MIAQESCGCRGSFGCREGLWLLGGAIFWEEIYDCIGGLYVVAA
jgi:hypothetical protein